MRLFPITTLTGLLLLTAANPAGACDGGDYALESASVVALQDTAPAAIGLSAAKKKSKAKKPKDEYMRAVPSK